MSLEVRVPRLAESITEATLVEWLKADGSAVKRDEPIATLETDKAAVEIVADEAGVLAHERRVGDVVKVGDVLGRIAPGAASAAAAAAPAKRDASDSAAASTAVGERGASAAGARGAAVPTTRPAGTPSAPSRGTERTARPPAAGRAAAPASAPAPAPADERPALSPSVRRIVEEQGLDPAALRGSGPGGRILKEDALRAAVERGGSGAGPTPGVGRADRAGEEAPTPDAAPPEAGEPGDRVVPMSRIRLRIAERLVQAQQTAAILTTFNEIDMTRVLEVRARHREAFERRHGVKLGFMSFFARACVQALADVPAVNAEIRGTDIVYHDAVHLGIAVGTPRGLVVPVVRDAHALDLAGLERGIARMAQRARDAKLTPQELSGGTFTITNGGVYGSLLSTPILNPPQSGILGMHKIEKRPVVVDDAVVVRPMMYVALSYDHRLVDGEQAVTFLVGVKARLEDPERMLLAV